VNPDKVWIEAGELIKSCPWEKELEDLESNASRLVEKEVQRF